jgi:hypothetical protein
MTITFQNPDDFEKSSSDPDAVPALVPIMKNIPQEKPLEHKMQGPNKRKKENFLKALENGETVTSAAAALKINRPDLYRWRCDDAAFDEAWVSAWSFGADMLEEEAIRRAVEGVEKPVFRGGEIVGHVRDYSDSMLMFLLKARKPELFGSMGGKTSARKENTDARKNTGDQGEIGDLKAEIIAAKRTLDRKLLQAVAAKPAKKVSE